MIIDKADLTRLSFLGEWKEDVKVRGVIIDRNGNKYEGQIFDDQPHGKGVTTFVSGSVH
jgi:hypothetical protein